MLQIIPVWDHILQGIDVWEALGHQIQENLDIDSTGAIIIKKVLPKTYTSNLALLGLISWRATSAESSCNASNGTHEEYSWGRPKSQKDLQSREHESLPYQNKEQYSSV
jgi:hypothetical protein